jgi:hypothetical protein
MTTTHPHTAELRSLLRTLTKHGFSPVSVDDGEERCATLTNAAAVDVMDSVDESTLYVRRGDASRTYALFIVLGNDPGEAVCDHTDYDLLTAAVGEYYDRWCQ